MNYPIHSSGASSEDQVQLLEEEISDLELELAKVDARLNSLETQIRTALYQQIVHIRELTALYKKQKSAKKDKRLEQKKKGKNYKEPLQTPLVLKEKEQASTRPEEEQELKRLYKEAIIHVHPDKFSQEDEHISSKATALTIKLIEIYQSGDLNELKGFHKHIISGNAMSHVPCQPGSTADPKAMLFFLKKKKDELKQTLEDRKHSYLYEALLTYQDVSVFIEELRVQFEDKIDKLKKRTRKG